MSGGGPPNIPSPGQLVGGKYLIHRLLGEGGMAFVFEAHHQRLGQRVALKLLHPDLARDDEIVARFEREARALALLKSRHVARVIDVDVTQDGLPYIVMEFLEGRDLDAELQHRGSLPYEEAIDYVLQTCAAMAEAHGTGIVHRDLKPANLFLAEDNGERVVKVLDFGISKVIGETTRLTGSGAVMGTVLYMSPEQVRATQDVDARADIWSLGMILFEAISGRPPWTGGSHQIAAAIVSTDAPDIRSFVQVPEPLAAAIRGTLVRDRDRRIGSVRELAGVLAPFAARGSLGAAIADQLVTGHSTPRMRPSYASISGASLTPMSSPHPSLLTPRASAKAATPAPDGSPEPRLRSLLVIGALLGALAAVGVVLGAVAMSARHQATVAPDGASAANAQPAASIASAPPSVVEPPLPVPAPPATGVESATVPPSASSARRPSPPKPTVQTTATASANAPPPFL